MFAARNVAVGPYTQSIRKKRQHAPENGQHNSLLQIQNIARHLRSQHLCTITTASFSRYSAGQPTLRWCTWRVRADMTPHGLPNPRAPRGISDVLTVRIRSTCMCAYFQCRSLLQPKSIVTKEQKYCRHHLNLPHWVQLRTLTRRRAVQCQSQAVQHKCVTAAHPQLLHTCIASLMGRDALHHSLPRAQSSTRGNSLAS